MHLNPLAVLAGGIVLWLIVLATGLIGRRMADAPAAKAAFAGNFPFTNSSRAIRETLRFLLSFLVAGCIAVMQTLIVHALGDAAATGFLLMIVPATFIFGFGYGAKVPANGTVRALGIFVAGTATSVVMFVVAQGLR